MAPKTRMFWNVRAMPSAARRSGGKRPMSRPFSAMRPALAAVMPEMRLNSVVLPAPLGPITACTAPVATCMSTASTATSPA